MWPRKRKEEEVLTLFLPRMTKTISNQKNMAMTTEPIGTISSTLVFSTTPRVNTTVSACRRARKQLGSFSGAMRPAAVETFLARLGVAADRSVVVFGMCTCVHVCLCLGKETAGVWPISNVIFYLATTIDRPSCSCQTPACRQRSVSFTRLQ